MSAAPGASGASTSPSAPWATACVSLAAVACFFWPDSVRVLAYDRQLALDGSVWRFWTSNVVHFSGSHLAWNLAVFLPAGVWLERILPGRAAWLCLLTPGLTGLALLLAEPDLQTYAGLSGLATAALTSLALTQLTRAAPGERRWWRLVLGLVALKIVIEAAQSRPLFATFTDGEVRPVLLAHLMGVACALALHRRWWRDRKAGSPDRS